MKHARASEVEVRFVLDDQKITLEVRDNGIGLGADRGSGRGLLDMQTREVEMGGILNITAARGTTVALDVPLD